MSDFESRSARDGFACKLWRGERMTMLGFDVEKAELDLVGFAIEVKPPGARDFSPLRNLCANTKLVANYLAFAKLAAIRI